MLYPKFKEANKKLDFVFVCRRDHMQQLILYMRKISLYVPYNRTASYFTKVKDYTFLSDILPTPLACKFLTNKLGVGATFSLG